MAQASDTKTLVDFRIAQLERDVEALQLRINSLESDKAQIDVSIAKLSERMTNFQYFQGLLSAILSGISYWFSK